VIIESTPAKGMQMPLAVMTGIEGEEDTEAKDEKSIDR
jgi:hypothetical protein